LHSARLRASGPRLLLAATLALTVVLGVAVLVVTHAAARSAQLREHPADPLTDEQARTLVVDAAVAIASAAGLRDRAGGYAFRSCKNADDPPYQVIVDMTFAVPRGNSVKFLDDVAAAMVSLGWERSETQSEHFGRKLAKAGLVSTFHRNPEQLDVATMRIYGECRVVADHRADDPGWVDITQGLRLAR
jgi:hypothetical protein